MNIYAHSPYHVPDALAEVHARCLDAISATGTWWTGRQRAALAAEVRAARHAAGTADSDDGSARRFDAAVNDAAREVAVHPQVLERDFYEVARTAGLGEEEYVETVAIAALTADLDIFARGIDIEPLALTPGAGEEPARTRPATAYNEGAWVATVPAGRRGGADARALYGEAMMPFIIRALSLVPAEARMHLDTEQAQYLPLPRFAEYDYRHHAGLSRAQVEVVAGRVSVLNECFY